MTIYTRIEADVIHINYVLIDIDEFVSSIYASGILRMPEGVELILEMGTNSCIFNADVVRLTQLINNLMNNAIKNTTIGCITIGSLCEDKQLCFYVRDITIDKLEDLSESFVKKMIIWKV